jgi:protoporphyrinogen oxidase
MDTYEKDTIILGGGPAGLAAGVELSKKGFLVSVFESETQVGGISKTVEYKGFYFDLGGHRFFTKIDEVQKVWKEAIGEDFRVTPRLSRIYYNNKFFNYPLTAMNALTGVGLKDTFIILASYIKSKFFPYPKEETFEEWVSNRFGKRLFSIFFKTYTEKVWGIPCSTIQAEWAAQRIKGLSLSSAIINALFKPKKTKIKTLIDEFHYPKKGPGMMYDAFSQIIQENGGKVFIKSKATKVYHSNQKITSVEIQQENNFIYYVEGKNFISSIPLTELVSIMHPTAPDEVLTAVDNLKYRSIITVDIIINKETLFPDNWIYIHSPEVLLGRIQNFKNWSPDMVADSKKTSLGLEYFCTEGDELWNMTDKELFELASNEIEKIKICNKKDIEDYVIIRVPKAYPVYETGYGKHVEVIRNWLSAFENLELVGRYGLFKYNNMDHSILTGLYAAQNIVNGTKAYSTWDINTESDYHEGEVPADK